MKNIKIFDTTLRDGEQSPGASMNIDEKIQIALQLEKLGVDIIEAGFGASSSGDFEAIQKISEAVSKSTICSLARAIDSDIKKAGDSILHNKNRIHTFIATSKIHMEHKLNMSEDEVIKRAINAVEYASTFSNDVEFSCEDAGRSDIGFLIEISDAVINAGAKTINFPDTVGFMLPQEIGQLIKTLDSFISDRAIISSHNHNDLGLGVSNAIEAIKNGATQIECTINGIGERAGNSALEEIVMILETRKDIFKEYSTNINIKEIFPTSQLVSSITGMKPQANKAIVGDNAFSHESGIHQDGILKNKSTYEIISPESIGKFKNENIVLGKLSGRAAFKNKITELGFSLSDEEININFLKFKELADKKKNVFDNDIRALIIGEMKNIDSIFSFSSVDFDNCGVIVSIIKDNETLIASIVGNGTIDSIFKSIDFISKIKGELIDYQVKSISEGKDSLAKAMVKVSFDGNIYTGSGLKVDTLDASAIAYISALNKYLNDK